MKYLLILLPILVLVASVMISVKAVKRGKKPRNVLLAQILTFALACALCLSLSVATYAATDSANTTTETSVSEQSNLKGSESPWGFGLGLLAVAAVTSFSCIGAGRAVAASAPAAIAATSENPDVFGKFLVIVALAEGIALYGVVISFMMLTKI